MLVGFTCKNYTSYREETVFSMLASSRKEHEAFNTFETRFGSLLKSALIFGANASGKSNLFNAMMYVREMVGLSVLNQKLTKVNEPFRFSVHSSEEPTLFEISFIANNVLYTYGFEIYKADIIKEWLYKKVEKTVPLFTRDNSDWKSISLYSEMKQAEDLKRFTRPDSLFISVAIMFNIEIVKDIVLWFSGFQIMVPENDFPYTVEYLEENLVSKQKILSFLKKANIGIEDFEFDLKDQDEQNIIEEREVFPSAKIAVKNISRDFTMTTTHNVYNDERQVANSVNLPFYEYQSEGTLKLFELLGPVINSLETGKPLIIDEIDSKLHPAIVRQILTLFNSIDQNKKNAQLICNTHDILLLEEEIRRDQIWFVDKNAYGESNLYSLIDFKNVRKNDPILKKYLLGIYGATPFKKGSELE